jgi:signal transduction histidine kinase
MINPSYIKMDLNVRTIRPYLSIFENMYGKKELIKFIEATGMPLEYFDDENNWVSYDYNCILLESLVIYSGEQQIPYKFGLTAATNMSWGIIATILKSFASCSFAYRTVISLSPRWAKTGAFQFTDLKKNKATIKYQLRKDLEQNRNNCLGIQGQLASIPTHWNLPPAKIHETQCAVEGADSCIYEISWKNPPTKKSGLYYFLAGVTISLLIYFIGIINNPALHTLQWSPIILVPLMLIYFRKIVTYKVAVKDSTNQIESQNEILEKNLVEIEKSNSLLQKKVEERTKELTASNDEIKKNIKDLKDNEDELIHTGKMTIVGQLAVDVANKLKKPVDKVRINVNTVAGKTTESDPIYESIAGAIRGASRCEKVIHDLLSFSSNNHNLTLQEVDINQVLTEAAGNTAEEITYSNIRIKKELDGNLPKITADYLQIKQVLMIIINNAHDAINESLKIDDKKESEILIKTSFKNNEIIIIISDTGIGIPKNIIGKIFDPFFSTKPAGKKKGIGLTIGYNAIKRLGGRIEVDSKRDKGTKFSIHLPVKNQTQ